MCARCHREKKNLRAILRSDGELISLPIRILLLVACRPRVRVKRACAVGMARRGAQIGRLGAPCKAGGHYWTLTHEYRCRRAPQIRAIGDPIGRAAPPHERSQPRTAHEPRRKLAMFHEETLLTQHKKLARHCLTFYDTPSEPPGACRRNHAETAAIHRAVPIGAFETAPDVGTNALGRCRVAVGRWNFVAWLKAGPTPFHQSGEGGYQGFQRLLHPDLRGLAQMWVPTWGASRVDVGADVGHFRYFSTGGGGRRFRGSAGHCDGRNNEQ